MRLEAARYAIAELQKRERITTWVIDDTGFLKQGKHSVGVQRQYTGSAGKIANCQLGVSLCIATPSEHLPIDFELYLPKSWIDDANRRKEARVPTDIVFKTKVELAIDMIQRAAHDGIPGEIVLADSFYGRSWELREAVRRVGLDYAVAVDADTRVWQLDAREHRTGDPIRVKAARACTRTASFPARDMAVRFEIEALVSFLLLPRQGRAGRWSRPGRREAVWLMVEWPEGESEPSKFVLTTLPRNLSKSQIARLVKERWRTERAYEDLKGELGLDHFEGRSFPGWHHHVSVVLCCYAFIVAERARHFPPSRRGTGPDGSVSRAA